MRSNTIKDIKKEIEEKTNERLAIVSKIKTLRRNLAKLEHKAKPRPILMKRGSDIVEYAANAY